LNTSAPFRKEPRSEKNAYINWKTSSPYQTITTSNLWFHALSGSLASWAVQHLVAAMGYSLTIPINTAYGSHRCNGKIVHIWHNHWSDRALDPAVFVPFPREGGEGYGDRRGTLLRLARLGLINWFQAMAEPGCLTSGWIIIIL